MFKDIEAAVERGAVGRIITSTYQNFTDIESLKKFFNLQSQCANFTCHLDHECFHDSGYMALGYHSKGYLFKYPDRKEVIIGSSNITRYALLKNIEWDIAVSEEQDAIVFEEAMKEFEDKWEVTHPLNLDIINLYSNKLNFAIERWDMDYFEPEFLLGLTATPERLDNQNVFELFDKNVPYELRLRDAIINDLVVPFKYYGIRDELINYGLTKSEERKMVAQLATVDHCNFITKEIEKHRPEGKLKALAFCRNVTHSRMMCEAMGEHYKTAYLNGKNDIGERIRVYNDFLHGILEDIDEDEKLLPIFTERQIAFANYLSAMLPLVRQHEYEIFKCLINGVTEAAQIQNHLADNVGDYLPEQFDHAMKFMIENGFVSLEDNHCCFHDVDIDEQFKEYLDDLLSYGLTRYTVDYETETKNTDWSMTK